MTEKYLKVNYSELESLISKIQDVRDNFTNFQTASQNFKEAVGGQKGKSFDAMIEAYEVIKNQQDEFLSRLDSIEDIIDRYIDGMNWSITPVEEVNSVVVDPLDIQSNLTAIRAAVASVSSICNSPVPQSPCDYWRHYYYNPDLTDDENEANEREVNEENYRERQRRQNNYDKLNNFRTGTATSFYQDILDCCSDLEEIYDCYVVPYDRTDDDFAAEMSECYANWKSLEESVEEGFAGAPKWLKTVMKGVGKFGVAGSYANSVFKMGNAIAVGEASEVGKEIVNMTKDGISRFGTLAKNAYDGKSVKETMLGDWTKGGAVTSLFATAEEAAKATKGQIFTKALGKEVKSYSFRNAKNVGGKIKVATKWGGAILSGVANYFENAEEGEKKGYSKNRIFAETACETVLDIGLGMLVTAGATVVIGASAPAVAVGAATVGVIWLADTVTGALTEEYVGDKKKFTEVFTDGFLDAVGVK